MAGDTAGRVARRSASRVVGLRRVLRHLDRLPQQLIRWLCPVPFGLPDRAFSEFPTVPGPLGADEAYRTRIFSWILDAGGNHGAPDYLTPTTATTGRIHGEPCVA
jgi:hypothetical protein